MAFLPGLRKQLNKANQFVSERFSGAEGTKLDDEFTLMERRIDVFGDMLEELQTKTKEYLQPNPTVRAKMAAVKGISKLSGQAKLSTYPQPEGTLGEAMANYGRKMHNFDPESVYASALLEMGEGLKQMADLKYALDDTVKQNFLEPMNNSQSKDLKEVQHHRKKLHGRKLDFDCKRRTGARDDEVKQAEEKFAESLQLAQVGMHNLLDGSGVEHVSQLSQLSQALLEYHKQCTSVLQDLTKHLYAKVNEASMKPPIEFTPKTLEDLGIDRSSHSDLHGSHPNLASATKPMHSTVSSNSLNKMTFNSYNVAANNNNNNNNTYSAAPYSSSSSYNVAESSDNYNPKGEDANANLLISFNSPGTYSSTSSWNNSAWHQPPVVHRSAPSAPAATTPSTSTSTTLTSSGPRCKALYDFVAENPGELSFSEGDIITLLSQIDDNWFDGAINGKQGYFPIAYVDVIQRLP